MEEVKGYGSEENGGIPEYGEAVVLKIFQIVCSM
jgi:hypothetical protein